MSACVTASGCFFVYYVTSRLQCITQPGVLYTCTMISVSARFTDVPHAVCYLVNSACEWIREFLVIGMQVASLYIEYTVGCVKSMVPCFQLKPNYLNFNHCLV